MDAEERAPRERLLATDPILARAHHLTQAFRRGIADRDIAALDAWLVDAHASDRAPFRALANGIEADRAAVEAALTLPWSNGPVEGHVHRVKLIKRQGYGCAKLDLLRARVLAS